MGAVTVGELLDTITDLLTNKTLNRTDEVLFDCNPNTILPIYEVKYIWKDPNSPALVMSEFEKKWEGN